MGITAENGAARNKISREMQDALAVQSQQRAAAAERMGLINRVLPAADLERDAMAFAQRLAQGPTVALGRLRRLMRTSFERDLSGQLDAESAAFRECALTEDFRLGIDAFFAKKAPAFTGR